MCQGVLCLIKGGCECDIDSPGRSGISQKYENERASQNLRKLTPVTIARLQLSKMVTSIEEITHVDYKAELAIPHQYISTVNYSFGSGNTESANDMGSDLESATFLKPYSCAGTLVMETGPADNVATDCSEVYLVHVPDENDTTITKCYTDSSTRNEKDSKEESGPVNTNKHLDPGSQTRATLENCFTLDEELSRDVMPFASDDDGVSRNESTFGVLSSHRRDFNYGNNYFKARIVGNSGLAGAYYQTDKTHTLPDNQLILPYPVASSSDDPVKKLVTGSHIYDSFYISIYISFAYAGSETVNVLQSCKISTVVDDHKDVLHRVIGDAKPAAAYPVVVGNSVKVFPTNLFASLPQHDKFLVKERLHDPTVGFTRAKLVLKSSSTQDTRC